jgi:hypothetical protein
MNNLDIAIYLKLLDYVGFIIAKVMLVLGFMVFNTTFNNISVISWRSALLVFKEIEIPDQNHRPAASHYIIAKKLSGISNIFCKFILESNLP